MYQLGIYYDHINYIFVRLYSYFTRVLSPNRNIPYMPWLPALIKVRGNWLETRGNARSAEYCCQTFQLTPKILRIFTLNAAEHSLF